MTVERALRLMAGVVVLASVALGVFVNQNWLWLTAFAGANLLQSAMTNWCPAMLPLRWMGLPTCQVPQAGKDESNRSITSPAV